MWGWGGPLRWDGHGKNIGTLELPLVNKQQSFTLSGERLAAGIL